MLLVARVAVSPSQVSGLSLPFFSQWHVLRTSSFFPPVIFLIFGCGGSSLLRGLSSGCGEWWRGGFSSRGVGSRARGPSGCGSGALERRLHGAAQA